MNLMEGALITISVLYLLYFDEAFFCLLIFDFSKNIRLAFHSESEWSDLKESPEDSEEWTIWYLESLSMYR